MAIPDPYSVVIATAKLMIDWRITILFLNGLSIEASPDEADNIAKELRFALGSGGYTKMPIRGNQGWILTIYGERKLITIQRAHVIDATESVNLTSPDARGLVKELEEFSAEARR